MSNATRLVGRFSVLSLVAAAVALWAGSARAVTYYWDNNGTTAGFGTAAGTWAVPTTGDSTQGWSTDATGVTLPGASVTTATTDSLNFGNGATGLAAGTIAVSGTVDAGDMTFASGSGAIVLSGGTINLAAAETIAVNNASDTIDSVLQGAATSLTKVGIGTLNLTGANTYTGATNINGGTLNLSGGGTILTTTGITLAGGNLTLTNTAAETGSGRVADAAPITSNGGTITYTNTSGGDTYAETIGSVDLASGQLNVVETTNQADAGSQTLTLSGLTHTGATNTSAVTFSSAGGLNATKNMIKVTGASGSGSGQNGPGGAIIGPWATAGTSAAVQTDYAVYDGSGYVIPANITASDETTWTTAANAYTLGTTGTTTLTGSRTITALRYTGAGVGTVALGAFNLETYGLLNGNSANPNQFVVSSASTGVVRTPVGGGSLYITTNTSTVATTATGLVIRAPIANSADGFDTRVVKSGAGILVLQSATSTFTGGLTLNQGLVWVAGTSERGMGAAGGGITFDGTATLCIGIAGLSSARPITVNNGAVATLITDSASASWTNSGAVTGNGGVAVEGPSLAANGQTYNSGGQGSTITLSSTANNFTGPVRVGIPISTSTGFAKLTINSLADSASTLSFGVQSGAQTFVWGAGAISPLVLNNRRVELLGTTQGGIIENANTANSNANTITINTDLLVTGVGAKTLTLGGVNTGANTFAGIIGNSSSGATSITKAQAGKWILSGANSYTGATSVNGGTLYINGNQSSATGNVTVASGATLGGTGTIGGATTIQSGGIYSPGNSPGTLTHAAGLTISAGGIFNWENNTVNTLGSAGTNWDVANLAGGATLSLGAGAKLKLSFTDAGTNFSDTFWDTSRAWDFITGGVSGSNAFDASYISIFVNGIQQGSNNIIASRGAFTTVVSGSNEQLVWTPDAPSPPTAFWSGQTSGNWGTLNNWYDAASGGVAVALLPGSATDVHFSTTSPSPGNLGAVDLAANVTVKTLSFDAAAAAVTMGSASGSILTIAPLSSADGIVVDATAGDNILNTKVALGVPQTWTIGAGRTLTATNQISGGSALTKAGDGTLTLSGTNTYGGSTTIAAGTLNANSTDALGNSSATNTLIFAGGTLQAGGTIASISTRGVTLTSTGTIDTNGNAVSIAGIVSGGGGLIKNGAGTLTLTAVNTFTGGTVVNEGTLSLPTAGAATGALRGSLTINAGAIVSANRAWAMGYGGPVFGTGPSVTSITINGGTLSWVDLGGSTADNGTAASTITMTGGTITGVPFAWFDGNTRAPTLRTLASSTRSTIDAGLSVRLTAATDNLTFDVASGTTSDGIDLLMSGVIRNGTAGGHDLGGIIKTGAGTMLLSGANTYTGVTTVNGGMLQFSNTASLYGGNSANWTAAKIVVNNSGAFAVNVGGPGEFATGDVTTLLTNLDRVVNNNGLRSGSAIGFDTANTSGGTFTIADTIADTTGTGGGAVGLKKLGANTLILSGPNTYTGLTTVKAGTLQLGASAQSVVLDPLVGAGADIQGGKMVLEYSGAAPDVRPLLQTSYLAGWSGGRFQIGGGRADASHGLGWADDAVSQVKIAYTFYGDATLDGYVNSDDLTKVLANYLQMTGMVWGQGDFNYDGAVDSTDLTKVLANYLQGPIVPGINALSYGGLDAQAIQMLTAAGFTVVPEPGTLVLLAAGLAALLCYAWRKRK